MSDEEYMYIATWIEQTPKRWLRWLGEIHVSIEEINENLKLQGEALDRIAKNILKKTDL